MRALFAITLSFVLAFSGVVLAEARGASHDMGVDMVICGGVGMVTIKIGPDGEPIETSEVCPDGYSVFAAAFQMPDLPRPEMRLVAEVEIVAQALPVSRTELEPAARGPPARV